MAERVVAAGPSGRAGGVNPFERAFECAPIGMAVLDRSGRVLQQNPALTRLLGARAREALSALAGEAPELASGAVHEAELEAPGPDGERKRLQCTFAAVGTADGTFVVQVQDVTERHRLEVERRLLNEQLVRSNRELEEFASVASHDLQEPLRKIQAFADRLRSKAGARLGDAGEDLARIQAAAARMQALIDDVLALARLERREIVFREIDLGDVVSAVAASASERVTALAGEIAVGELPTIQADSGQMHQLFENLVGNALKFRRPDEPPLVRVYAERAEPDRVVICCEDNGIGFDERYGEQIFAMFERLHGRQAYEGTGIGLALCRTIAGRHGGTIRAESAPGRGSRFLVTLPRTQPGVLTRDEGGR